MKKIYDRPLEEQINDRRKQKKANVVFLKLFPKHKNTKSWVSIKSQTFPSIIDPQPGESTKDLYMKK